MKLEPRRRSRIVPPASGAAARFGLWLFGMTLVACGSSAQPSPSVSPAATGSPSATGAGPSCQPYGGCDIEEDLANGSQKYVGLDSESYPTALEIALYDAQQSGVRDTIVVGHNPPHDAISGINRHT